LAIVLSVLRFTDSDYPFGIFKLFFMAIVLSCDVRYDFHGKIMFGSTSLPLVLLTFVLYLRYLYLFKHTVVYVDFIMI